MKSVAGSFVRVLVATLCLSPFIEVGVAADQRHVGHSGAVLFEPTVPLGVAGGLPKSPLADWVVNREARFSTQDQAQARCPTDAVVWVAADSEVYRPVPPSRHARAQQDAFLCLTDASIEGDLPAHGR